jgi:hypothetical protein
MAIGISSMGFTNVATDTRMTIEVFLGHLWSPILMAPPVCHPLLLAASGHYLIRKPLSKKVTTSFPFLKALL